VLPLLHVVPGTLLLLLLLLLLAHSQQCCGWAWLQVVGDLLQ
jgi:hypothetical protein